MNHPVTLKPEIYVYLDIEQQGKEEVRGEDRT